MEQENKQNLVKDVVESHDDEGSKSRGISSWERKLDKANALISKYVPHEKISRFMSKAVVCIDWVADYITREQSDNFERNEVVQAARSPIMFGLFVVIVMVVFAGAWICFAVLDTASHCPGIVVVDSNRKVIQHLEGGIIKEIYVQDGDVVKAGQKLLLLSNAKADATYDVMSASLYNFEANQARLRAEMSGSETIDYPDSIKLHLDVLEIKAVHDSQNKLFASNLEAYKNEVGMREKKVQQLEQQVEAYKARSASANKQYELMKTQFNASKALESKGYVSKNQLVELETKLTAFEGESREYTNKVIEAGHALESAKIELGNYKTSYMTNLARELKDTEMSLSEAVAKVNSSKDEKVRLLITSPIDGTVHGFYSTSQFGQVQNYTVGGVIASGVRIMDIIPIDDNLIIEARVSQQDIDAVSIGMKTKIKITAFKSRNTPDIIGKVVYVASDVNQDSSYKNPTTGMPDPYYAVKIVVDKKQMAENPRLRNLKLQPGMYADVSIISGHKTFIRYLLDPITDSFRSSFSER